MAIHTNQMQAPNNTVNVDNLQKLSIIDIVDLFGNPHPHVLIRLVTDEGKPVHKSTRIVNALILEGEKDVDLGLGQCQYPACPACWGPFQQKIMSNQGAHLCHDGVA